MYKDYNIKKDLYYYKLKQVDFDGVETESDVIEIMTNLSDYALKIFPNPVTNTTQTNVTFTIPKSGMVEVNVYDFGGRNYASLTKQYMEAGTYTLPLSFPKGTEEMVFVNLFFNGKNLLSEPVLITN